MDIEATIVSLLRQRSPESSICPSEVARALASDEAEWRTLMQPVRHAAAVLARQGKLSITQGERQVDPRDIDHGAIRLRRGQAFPEE
ncbi:DUF3253 domain-containing protein [Bacillus sp. NP157]|nr:DUF3253 domain-containing protein [Bacillus sp. NP157]